MSTRKKTKKKMCACGFPQSSPIKHKHDWSPKLRKQMEKYSRSLEHQLGLLILEARLNSAFTQEKLAKKIGTQQPSIARVEQEKYIPSLRFLEKIAKACGGYIQIKFISHKL